MRGGHGRGHGGQRELAAALLLRPLAVQAQHGIPAAAAAGLPIAKRGPAQLLHVLLPVLRLAGVVGADGKAPLKAHALIACRGRQPPVAPVVLPLRGQAVAAAVHVVVAVFALHARIGVCLARADVGKGHIHVLRAVRAFARRPCAGFPRAALRCQAQAQAPQARAGAAQPILRQRGAAHVAQRTLAIQRALRPLEQLHALHSRQRLRREHALLQQHCEQPWTAAELARLTGLNEKRLQAGFQHLYGLRTCSRSRHGRAGRGFGRSAALRSLPMARAIGGATRLATHPKPHPIRLAPKS